MTVLFLASLDTSSTIFWLFAYLLQHPQWLSKVQAEVFTFLAHSSCDKDDLPSSMAAQLSGLPLSAWESPHTFPVLDLCIQETLRLVISGTLLRRNMGDAATIDGRTIRHGEYAVLMTDNLHFNTEIYDQPYRFVPDRDLSAATERGSFVGWGSGKLRCSVLLDYLFTLSAAAGVHACAGRRYAQFLIKAVIVVVLGQYKLDLKLGEDALPGILPGIQRNLSYSSIGDPVEEIQFSYARHRFV